MEVTNLRIATPTILCYTVNRLRELALRLVVLSHQALRHFFHIFAKISGILDLSSEEKAKHFLPR